MPVHPPNPPDFPLNALRAFEAAARLGGFAAAAVELGVTPGAVAAQIKSLESRIGVALFDRRAQGVALTPVAAKVFPQLQSAFDALAMASRTLREEAQPQRVHIAALPCLAQLWLSPQLPGLRARSPEIVVSITAMETPPQVKRSPYDLCLFYGTGPGQRLADDVIFPVCTPEIAARLHHPQQLGALPCIADASWAQDWPNWMRHVGAGEVVVKGPVYSLYSLAVEEAVNGGGVLMGHADLIARHLETGRLVAPFPQKLRLDRGLYLWSSRAKARQGGPIALVQDWLVKGQRPL